MKFDKMSVSCLMSRYVYSTKLDNVERIRKKSSKQRTAGTTEYFGTFRFYLLVLLILFDEISITYLYKAVKI